MAKSEISRPQTAHIAPFGLRLQPDLKAALEAAARAAGRSLNAEIAFRLEQSFADEALLAAYKGYAKQLRGGETSGPFDPEMAQRLDRLMLQVDALHKWMQRQPEEGGIFLEDEEPAPAKAKRR